MNSVKNSPDFSIPLRFSVRRILILGIPFLALALGIAFFSNGHRSAGPDIHRVSVPIDYKRLIADRVTEALRQDGLAVARFNEGLTKALIRYTAQSESAALETAQKLSSADDIAHILFYLAKDQTTLGHQTDDYLDSEIQPILTPLLGDFGRVANLLIQTLDSDLYRISVQLAVDLASVGPLANSKANWTVIPRQSGH
jgi:hypothetical protein